jgi:hypothetical protein
MLDQKRRNPQQDGENQLRSRGQDLGEREARTQGQGPEGPSRENPRRNVAARPRSQRDEQSNY